eukprot:3882585-Amphidinium_carterae.1
MDCRNFQKLTAVLKPCYLKACRPGAQWPSAKIHCPDPQLSVSNWGVNVAIGWLRSEPEPLSTGELVSLLHTCLALIDPTSYLENPPSANKKVQHQASQLHVTLMPQLEDALERLSIEREAQA